MVVRDYCRSVLTGEERTATAFVLTALLFPLSLLYAAVMVLRGALYDHGLLPVQRLQRPVISIGNLTLGGTGKTPLAILLSRMLMARGLRVCVLSRGYGGTLSPGMGIIADGTTLLATPAEAGDEPWLMARTVPGLSVVVGADRHAAGLLAQERLNPDIFILDDGFQHRRLARDLDIVLLDAQRPFANGLVFPAGGMREPRRGLSRAHLAIFSRWQPGMFLPELPLPACCACHLPGAVHPLGGGPAVALSDLAGERVAAFAGIASPDGFFAMLRQAGVTPLATLALPDHATYGAGEVEALQHLAAGVGAKVLLTTAKDAVKLAPWADQLGDVRVVLLEMQLRQPEMLERLLATLLSGYKRGGE